MWGARPRKTLEGQRGSVLFYCFPNEGHTDRMEIKWNILMKYVFFFVFAVILLQDRCSAQESPESTDLSLWYLVASVTSTVSPNKQRGGIWQGRHSSGSLLREVKRFLYVEIL